MKITVTRLTRLFGGADGVALTANHILLHPSRKDDAALIAHERIHCQQIAAVGGARAFWWAYLTSRDFRLEAEIEAYRVQLAMRPDLLNAFANRLAGSYWLGITADDARRLLTNTTH